MDDRGHGKTEAEADPRKLRNWDPFVEDLESFFEYLGEPVIAMGHSRGAVASLMLAVRRPDLVRALVLVDPTIIPFYMNVLLYLAQLTGMEKKIPIVAVASKRKRDWPDREALIDSYKDRLPFKRWEEGFLESYIDWGFRENSNGSMSLACDPAWESACFGSCPVNIWSFIKRLHKPTLVVCGDGSDVFRPGTGRRLKRTVPGVKLVCLENTSHFVPMERPGQTAQIIKEYVRALS
jgi:pimeloyl-ACP methyl ester carboxylesterase